MRLRKGDEQPPDVARGDVESASLYLRALAVRLVQIADARGRVVFGRAEEPAAVLGRILRATPGERRLLRRHYAQLVARGFLVEDAAGVRVRGFHQAREALITPACNRYVYFARDEATGEIKIGIASDVPDRLVALRTPAGGAVTLLAALRVRDAERDHHALFAEYRTRGEWFRPAPALLEYIALVAEGMPAR